MDSSRSLSHFLSTLETCSEEELLLILVEAHRELDTRVGGNPHTGKSHFSSGFGAWTACGLRAGSHDTGCVGQVTCKKCEKSDQFKFEAGTLARPEPWVSPDGEHGSDDW